MKGLKDKRIIISGIAAVVVLITALATNNYINKLKAREEFKKVIETNKESNNKVTTIEEKDTVNSPLTPDTILANGLTAAEGRNLLQFQIDLCNYQELSEEEKMNLLEQLCKDMGTTYDELIKIELAEVKPQQQIKEPATTKQESESTYQESEGNQQGSNSGSTQQKPSNEVFDNGNIFNNDNYSGGGVGSTVESPDVIFEMPGDESSSNGDGTGGDGSFDGLHIDGEGSTVESPDVTFEMP